MITTAFTLAKMLRDKHESDLAAALYSARAMRSEQRNHEVSNSQERV